MATASTPCLIAFGGNIGDVPAHFRRALHMLRSAGIVPVAVSQRYTTAAMVAPGAGPQTPYENAVVLAHTALTGPSLVAACHDIGTSFGARLGPKGGRWQARPLDVDVLARGDDQSDHPHCQLPHAGLAFRPFVLWPVRDVAPDWRFGPHRYTAADYLARLAQPQRSLMQTRLTWCGDKPFNS